MTQSNNSFVTTNNKMRKFWNDVETNRITIDVQTDKQDVIITELGRSISVNSKNDKILELNTEWITPEVSAVVSVGSEVPRTVFKNWEVQITGLSFKDAISLRHNFNFRFAGGSFDADIRGSDTLFHTNHYILSESLEEGPTNVLTFYYGMFLDDASGLLEVQEDGLEARLQLTLLNPSYHS